MLLRDSFPQQWKPSGHFGGRDALQTNGTGIDHDDPRPIRRSRFLPLLPLRQCERSPAPFLGCSLSAVPYCCQTTRGSKMSWPKLRALAASRARTCPWPKPTQTMVPRKAWSLTARCRQTITYPRQHVNLQHALPLLRPLCATTLTATLQAHKNDPTLSASFSSNPTQQQVSPPANFFHENGTPIST